MLSGKSTIEEVERARGAFAQVHFEEPGVDLGDEMPGMSVGSVSAIPAQDDDSDDALYG